MLEKCCFGLKDLPNALNIHINVDIRDSYRLLGRNTPLNIHTGIMSLVHRTTFTFSFDVGHCWWPVIIVKLGELCISDTKLFHAFFPQQQHDCSTRRLGVNVNIVASSHKYINTLEALVVHSKQTKVSQI